MEKSSNPKSPNTRSYLNSTLETLQHSFENFYVRSGVFEFDGSATAQSHGNRPLNASLTDFLPRPGFSNLINRNGAGYDQSYRFAEDLAATPWNAACGFSAPYLYNWASQERNASMSNNVNLLGGEATPTAGNLWGNGFNIDTQNSSGFWTQQRMNGNVSPKGNYIINLAMTEDGSKYFQDLLMLKSPRIKKLIFEGVIEYIFKLMTNQHGRYLFRKLIEWEDQNQLQMIMEKLTLSSEDIFHASIDRYGSYSIKKMIKAVEKSPLITKVVKALSEKFWQLMINPTGQYVIMECLDVVDSEKNELLYIEAINNCLKLATHERGCASLNSFISRIKGPRRDELLNLICDHAAFLAQDPSGNFVVQCVLGLQNPAIIHKLCSKLKGYYVKLSMQKGGSHIVEKCLTSSGMDIVVHELVRSNQLVRVAKDRYGNYVVQTAIKETKKTGCPLHECLIGKLEKHLNFLLHGYGRHILTLIAATVNYGTFCPK
ncbi:hypothetical protein DITRI_Ditri17bG0037600 [Diplodiscus trichospermus]